MPIYTLHVHKHNPYEDPSFFHTLTRLHSQTFGTTRDVVRVNFVSDLVEDAHTTIERHGGVGSKIALGLAQSRKATGYLVIQMDFRGSAADWEEYCTVIVRYRPAIRSIYLQKLEFEFERRDPNLLGSIVTPPREDPSSIVRDILSAAQLQPQVQNEDDEPLSPYQR